MGLFATRWASVAYGENQEEVFLGHSVARNQNVSEETAKIIDAEVKRLAQAGFDEARRILTEKLEDLHILAKALLEYETLSGDEIIKRLEGRAAGARRGRGHASPRAPAVAVPLTHGPSLSRRKAWSIVERTNPSPDRVRGGFVVRPSTGPGWNEVRSPMTLSPRHGHRQRHARQLLRRRALLTAWRPACAHARRLIARGRRHPRHRRRVHPPAAPSR